MDFDTRVGAYGVIVQDGTLLMSLWEGPLEALWTLPGGRIELGEQPEQACLREIEEETGYTARLDGLLGVISRTIDAEHRTHDLNRALLTVQVLYRAEIVSGHLRAEVGGSSSDAAWIPLDELHRHPTSPHVLRALDLAGVGL
jgi:8-oxo-dGTP diphosphatase